MAQCVDRLLYSEHKPQRSEHKPQRYGTVRATIAGETRLPALDPSLTDEERAELGLPPAAQLRRELEQANRDAARHVAEHGLPEGPNLRRVYRGLRAAELAGMLGERTEALWRDGDDVVFSWRGSTPAVTVWFGIEMAMEQLKGSDLWVLVVRIRDLDRAAFSYRFLPADGREPRQWAERSATWRDLRHRRRWPSRRRTSATCDLWSSIVPPWASIDASTCICPPATIVATRMESCTPPTGG